MNRRILPFSLVVCGAILAYACSSKDSTDPTPNPVPEGGSTTDGPKPEDDSGTLPDGAKTDGAIPSGNPIEGIANPADIPVFNNPPLSTEGPVWRTDRLYFSAPVAIDGKFVKLALPNTPTEVRGITPGNVPIGNAFDKKTNTFVSCEVTPGGGGLLVRTPAAGGVGTPITLTFDGGVPLFDSPNDLVVRADGTIFVTDPGYQGAPLNNNHIWRVRPTGVGGVTADIFETNVVGRPNGIALSPDEKTLYVSFTEPDALALPMIMKYPVAASDGALGVATKFADVGPLTSDLDGLAVDTAGNVYAAVKNGVEVFKADGTKWPNRITTTKQINGLAFGGADKKTLFMTSFTGMLQVTVKIAGIE